MQAFVEMPNLKLAVIVDDDIDVFNEREVMWAVATRVHWDKDIEIIREVQSFRGWLGDAVAIIDATIPLKGEWPVRNEIESCGFRARGKILQIGNTSMADKIKFIYKATERLVAKQEVSCKPRKSMWRSASTAKIL